MSKKLLLLFILFFLLIAGNSFAAFPIEVPLLGLPANPTLPQYIAFFFKLAIALGGVLAVLSLGVSGLKYISSAGNPEAVSDAKKMATSAIVGLILLLSSFIIIVTIDPSFENLQYKEGLKPIDQLFFINCSSYSSTECKDMVFGKPAPRRMENLDEIKKEFGAIMWRRSVTDLSEKPISMCEEGNLNAVYVIYWYKDYNFQNFIKATRLRCGQWTELVGAKSYQFAKEEPGVYFYDDLGCSPKIGSANIPVKAHTKSIPEDLGIRGATVRSIRIVNDPDSKKGPYGLIFFNSTDYRTGSFTTRFRHFMFSTNLSEQQKADNNSICFPILALDSKGTSWAIYKWVGWQANGMTPNSAGDGVDLYTAVAWAWGKASFNPTGGTSWTSLMQIDLKNTPVDYSQTTAVTLERQQQCPTFDPYYSCLQSFEIKGNYLVLVSSVPDHFGRNNSSDSGYAQVFPISPRLDQAFTNRKAGYSIERGTPKLDSDYITSRYAYFMEIIPLAETLQ